MTEKQNLHLIGDHRDIPFALGMIVVGWNRCELHIRELLKALTTAGDVLRQRAIEPIIVELGTVGMAQALNCLAEEFPTEQHDIAEGVRHVANMYERCRAYRNYYVHGISAVTRYGIFIDAEDFEKDTPLHEAMREGPYGTIHNRSGKNKFKFGMDHVDTEQLVRFNNTLGDLGDYTENLNLTVGHYFRRFDYKKTAPLPQPLQLPSALEKRVWSHPKMKPLPALRLLDPAILQGLADEDAADKRALEGEG